MSRQAKVVEVEQGPLTPAAFRQRDAEAYIGMGERWLDDAPVPRVDMRKAGAQRPVWVWLKADLDAFLAARRVLPGMPNPQAAQ